jgi:hypothetical protein
MTTTKQNPWIHIPQFLSRQHSDILRKLLADFPWIGEASEAQRRSVCFGKSYTRDGGPTPHEHGAIHPALLPIAKQVAYATQAPVNYVQCHEMSRDDFVTPHKDPAKMIVPMLTLGQARTFRVGGKMPQGYYRISQKSRKVERHQPVEEILMNHGDLLIFTGGHVVHSMFPTAQDAAFAANGFDVRYSLLFRWTTDEMREHGPKTAGAMQSHFEHYQEAVENFRKGVTDFLGMPTPSTPKQ